jgi:hypothetical protein
MKKYIDEFDSKYTTLIDYFTLMGVSNLDMETALLSAKKNHKASFIPRILSRTPHIDKPSVAFPS